MDRIIKIIVETKATREVLLTVTRLVTHSLMLSNNIRRDTRTILYFLDENKKIVFDGKTIRNLRVDEESAFGLVKKFYREKAVPITREDMKELFEGTCLLWGDNSKKNNGYNNLCYEDPVKIIVGYPQQGTLMKKCRRKTWINCTQTPIEALILINMVIDNCLSRN